jgi:hypothetical protein
VTEWAEILVRCPTERWAASTATQISPLIFVFLGFPFSFYYLLSQNPTPLSS